MTVERIGEDMAAGAIGDEIKLARARGIGHRLERGPAGIGDRTRRQAIDLIGIIGRRLVDLGARQRPAERPLSADDAIDNRRIGLQPHMFAQPVDKDAGDARPLVGLAGLLFDDGGQRDHFIGRGDRQVSRTPLPDLVEQLLLVARHFLQQLVAAGAALEFIGFRQQRTFTRNFMDVAGQNLVIAQTLDDLLAGQPFRDRDHVQNRLALHHRVDHVLQRGVLLELIFAGLELAPVALDEQGEIE